MSTRLRYHPTRGLAVLATAAAVVAATMTAAEPSAHAGPPSAEQSRMVEQRPLVDAATVVRSGVEDLGTDGLASIVIEEESVAVWWQGGRAALPDPVAEVIEQAEQVAPVRVADAAYSQAELLAASAELENRLSSDPHFHGIKAEPDGSGLIVAFDRAAPAATTRTLSDAGVSARASVEEALQPVSRGDDSPPWSGGAQIINTSIGAGCTSGFGVDTPDGPAILTAGHCGESGDSITDGGGESIGSVGADNNNFDVLVIPTDSVDNKIYVGGGDSTEQRTVTSGGAPFVGERVCQSGNTSANSVGGPICNMEVQFEHTDSQRLWEATQLDGETAARPGDSGGPVYLDNGDGTVTARGTTTRVAGSGFGFAGFEKSQQEFDVSIPGGE